MRKTLPHFLLALMLLMFGCFDEQPPQEPLTDPPPISADLVAFAKSVDKTGSQGVLSALVVLAPYIDTYGWAGADGALFYQTEVVSDVHRPQMYVLMVGKSNTTVRNRASNADGVFTPWSAWSDTMRAD